MQPRVNKQNIIHENKEENGNPSLPYYPFQIYEVIRIIDGIPLFLEDHLERLYTTAEQSGIFNLPGQDNIKKKIEKLITDNNRLIGNIKLIFTITDPAQRPKSELFFIPHSYPSKEKYRSGVRLGLLYAERPNPWLKIVYPYVRDKADLLISENNLFEVLLVDKDDNIAEGSRSNVFFVKHNQLYTSPDEKVLNGITRKKIFKLCLKNDIQLIKEDIPLISLEEFEGAILTGSSPKVLPVSAIGKISFNPSIPLIRRLINLYDQEIEEYLDSKRTSK